MSHKYIEVIGRTNKSTVVLYRSNIQRNVSQFLKHHNLTDHFGKTFTQDVTVGSQKSTGVVLEHLG